MTTLATGWYFFVVSIPPCWHSGEFFQCLIPGILFFLSLALFGSFLSFTFWLIPRVPHRKEKPEHGGIQENL
jgi:hypothetical protein